MDQTPVRQKVFMDTGIYGPDELGVSKHPATEEPSRCVVLGTADRRTPHCSPKMLQICKCTFHPLWNKPQTFLKFLQD